MKYIRGGFIESPVMERDTGVDRLQLPFETQDVDAVPSQKSGSAMCLAKSDAVYLLIYLVIVKRHVQDCQGVDEAVSFFLGELIGVFPHANHECFSAESYPLQVGAVLSYLYNGILVAQARKVELSCNDKIRPASVGGQGDVQSGLSGCCGGMGLTHNSIE